MARSEHTGSSTAHTGDECGILTVSGAISQEEGTGIPGDRQCSRPLVSDDPRPPREKLYALLMTSARWLPGQMEAFWKLIQKLSDREGFYDRLDWQAIEHDFRKDIPGKSLKQCRQRYYKIREKVEAMMLNHCEDLAVNDSRLV